MNEDKDFWKMIVWVVIFIITFPITSILVIYLVLVNGLGYIALKVEDLLFWFEDKMEKLMRDDWIKIYDLTNPVNVVYIAINGNVDSQFFFERYCGFVGKYCKECWRMVWQNIK